MKHVCQLNRGGPGSAQLTLHIPAFLHSDILRLVIIYSEPGREGGGWHKFLQEFLGKLGTSLFTLSIHFEYNM